MALFNRKNTTDTDELVSPQRSEYGLAILLELNRSGRHIYEGTVGRVVRDRRRATNKRAHLREELVQLGAMAAAWADVLPRPVQPRTPSRVPGLH